MSAPLTFLGPAIDLIARNASVLPAVGGAFEDLARPDVEEADDRFFGSQTDAEQGFDTFAEVPTPDWHDLYRANAALIEALELAANRLPWPVARSPTAWLALAMRSTRDAPDLSLASTRVSETVSTAILSGTNCLSIPGTQWQRFLPYFGNIPGQPAIASWGRRPGMAR
jgi:hypothetical protein